MMLRGLTKLTWIEIKVFMREPMGAIGTIVIPVVLLCGPGSLFNSKTARPRIASGFSGSGLPVLVSLLISISAVLSLVTIISIYREGGILKRLRATRFARKPSSPPTCSSSCCSPPQPWP
jgi:ABC-2 type transport system permease protein